MLQRWTAAARVQSSFVHSNRSGLSPSLLSMASSGCTCLSLSSGPAQAGEEEREGGREGGWVSWGRQGAVR